MILKASNVEIDGCKERSSGSNSAFLGCSY